MERKSSRCTCRWRRDRVICRRMVAGIRDSGLRGATLRITESTGRAGGFNVRLAARISIDAEWKGFEIVSLASLQDAKEQVRQAVDIVDLVGGYSALRRQGRGYVALCPWHDDSRPSLQINPERQSWKCWVCDIGGDIFSWVMRAEGLEFREALEMLAERAGVTLKPTAKPQSAAESQFDRRGLLKAMAWVEEQFHLCLLRTPEAEPARRYLSDRGITSESAAKFRLGFAPLQWDWLIK